jgi:hypothetical protein
MSDQRTATVTVSVTIQSYVFLHIEKESAGLYIAKWESNDPDCSKPEILYREHRFMLAESDTYYVVDVRSQQLFASKM